MSEPLTKTLALKFQIRVPSFDQQADLLIKALKPFYKQIMIPTTQTYGQRYTSMIVFTPAISSYLHVLGGWGILTHAQKVMYVTAEGVPVNCNVARNLINPTSSGWTVICVSEFAKDMMLKAGLRVDGVVPHAIDEDEPLRVSVKAHQLREHYESLFKNKVLFAYTGSTVTRKRVDLMIPAFRKAVEKTGNKIALISNSHLSNLTRPNVVSPNPQPVTPADTWFLEESIFGSAPHEYVTALNSASDYCLWSTICEGFGVPPLEAMSCSKPVIAGKFRPSTEFMNDQTTIWFDCLNVKYENYGMEQEFEMHYYDESALVDAIVQATDIFVNYKDSYYAMCEAAKEQASRYDYRKVYGIELRKWLS